MAIVNTGRFEGRFRTAEALAAGRRLISEATATGLSVRSLNSDAVAIEFDDSGGQTPFSAIANDGHALVYLREPALKRFPGLFERAAQEFGAIRPNRNGEYRLRVRDVAEVERLLNWLRKERVWPWRAVGLAPQLRRDGRLPAAVLDRVSSAHVLAAASDLANGFNDHDFSENTDYEVVYEKGRLKPKALFGVAATRALGFRVLPSHFSGGLGTQCFRKIEQAGLPIIKVGNGITAASIRTIRPTEFEVGKSYTRVEVATLAGKTDYDGGGSWDTGYDSCNGEYFLFCNIGAAGRTGHDYSNRWHNGRLIWVAKTGTRLGQPQIGELLSGQMPVHIFWRGKDRAPFTYAGLAVAESVEDTSPVVVTWLLDSSDLPAADLVAHPLWRRGPPPSYSERNIHRQDGPTSVYLMVLTGASSATFPALPEGMKLAKIGMSNDPLRRLIELNSGIPRGCVLRWSFVRAREYTSGPTAYDAEGALLEAFRDAGKWLGNEFISVTEADLEDLLN